jgi:hypothetical protein
MSNREVAGLQELAQRHGGNLSVNPDTGLPEAGFLDNLLPMVAGAGLTYFSGGAINPMMAAGIVGGISALDSKDLSKGLVAGLGAYGGAGMVGGLAGLGAEAAYMPGAAGEAARAAGTEAAIANGTYQSQVGTGLGNFIDQPMNSLSTLGGGSAIKGSLPILEGLAPAAVEAFDEEDEGDGAPAQHKGYIRKYALDPVTGQYKQVGAYEAGGDPNVDVSDKAGTAGAFGGVGQSEYEAAQGMAAGGTATDSSRIYDYLMGRGENPMQFRHTTAPQVNYNIPKPPEPITPTTPILDPQYDQYGNRISGGGGRQTAPEGEPGEGFNPSPEFAQSMLDAGKALSNVPVIAPLGMPLKALGSLATKYGSYLSTVAERNAAANNVAKYGVPVGSLAAQSSRVLGQLRSNEGYGPGPDGPYGPGNDGLGGISGVTGEPGISGVTQAPGELGREGMGTGAPGINGDPNQGNEGMHSVQGPSEGGPPPSGERGGSQSGGGYGGGAATGGNNGDASGGGDRGTRGGFAQGGISNLHQYNLGSYSDGGRLLKGPGDGVSDDIPATIGHGQPARLADGEFVIPARIVSEIGNGSTDAGARELYKMMDRIQAGRRKTVGKDQVAKNSKAVRHLPA